MSARPGYRGDLQTRLLTLSVLDPVTGCWIWIGATIVNRRGFRYGAIKHEGKRALAHRVAFKAFKGVDLPRKKKGAHLCNNTLCINPDHCAPKTQKQNMKQAAREKRMYRQENWCGNGCIDSSLRE
jgi:hypothetical protein